MIKKKNSLENFRDWRLIRENRESFSPRTICIIRYQELLQLNVSKACGPDLIPPLLLKRAAEHICVPLSKSFNQSMSSGKLPLDWVTANVVPIHKKSDKRLPSNYRPISLTSIIVKIMERIVRRQMVGILTQHNRLIVILSMVFVLIVLLPHCC